MRRLSLVLVLVALWWGTMDSAAQQPAPQPRFATPGSQAQTIDLKTTLEKGLKARRPEEFAFVARVVALVELKVLPIALVQSTYLWARRVPRTPFPYFERALRLRAARAGIDI